jgi:hypothetical protein
VRRFSGCCLRLLSITVPLFSSRPESAYRIINLAHSLLESAGLNRRQIECRFTGLRPGEKISELMTFDEESLAMSSVSGW